MLGGGADQLVSGRGTGGLVPLGGSIAGRRAGQNGSQLVEDRPAGGLGQISPWDGGGCPALEGLRPVGSTGRVGGSERRTSWSPSTGRGTTSTQGGGQRRRRTGRWTERATSWSITGRLSSHPEPTGRPPTLTRVPVKHGGGQHPNGGPGGWVGDLERWTRWTEQNYSHPETENEIENQK